jgi:hypothetical protein
MADKPKQEFGRRKPVSVPAAPPSGAPAKRSGQVVLLLMGTVAVGTAAYALMPRDNCQQPSNPSLQQGNAPECQSRSSSSSGGGSSRGWSSGSHYGSSDSSSGQASSGTHDSHAVQRSGFGSFASHFSGGG